MITIFYSEKPVICEKDVESIQTLSTDQAAQKLGMMAWIEESIFDPDLLLKDINDKNLVLDEYNEKLLVQETKKFTSGLVLCNMGKTGYGVFTLYSIPKGSYVSIYSGITSNIKTQSSYEAARKVGKAIFRVNTEYHGNISRCFQHLPSDLSQYSFSKGVKVQTANLTFAAVIKDKKPYMVFQAHCDIPAYTQLGFDYEDDYWLARNELPDLFSLDGKVIPNTDYSAPLQFQWQQFFSSKTDKKEEKNSGNKTDSNASKLTINSSNIKKKEPSSKEQSSSKKIDLLSLESSLSSENKCLAGNSRITFFNLTAASYPGLNKKKEFWGGNRELQQQYLSMASVSSATSTKP